MNSSERKELLRDLREIIEEMNRDLDAVIVEGKHDREALRKLGFEKEILKASRLSSSDVLDKEVSILTDFDKEGNKLRRKILERVSSKASVKKRFRRKLGKELGLYGRRDVESINNLL